MPAGPARTDFVLLLAGLALCPGLSVRAEPDSQEPEAPELGQLDPEHRRPVTILLSDDPTQLPAEPFGLAPWLTENVGFGRGGLKFVERYGEKGAGQVILRIRGPVMKDERFGVLVDFRF